MITKHAAGYDPAHAPRDVGALVQSAFLLWFASIRTTFWPAFALAFFSQLVWLPWWWSTRGQFEHEPLMAWISPDVFRPTLSTTCAGIFLALISLYFFLVLLLRQGRMARGLDVNRRGSWRSAWLCYPRAWLVSITYSLLSLAALLPLGIAVVLAGGDDPLRLLLAMLIGLLLSAVPLAWVSIAAALVYPPVLLDGYRGLAAQKLSFQLVHKHWLQAATLMSISLFAYLGILGTVGLAPLFITAAIAFLMDGPEALLRPGWLVFGQLLSAPLMAVLLPLATAGYSVCYEDLLLRWLGREKSSGHG